LIVSFFALPDGIGLLAGKAGEGLRREYANFAFVRRNASVF
jgi:hypothetical protein